MPASAGMTERDQVSQKEREKRLSGRLKCLLTSELINMRFDHCISHLTLERLVISR